MHWIKVFLQLFGTNKILLNILTFLFQFPNLEKSIVRNSTLPLPILFHLRNSISSTLPNLNSITVVIPAELQAAVLPDIFTDQVKQPLTYEWAVENSCSTLICSQYLQLIYTFHILFHIVVSRHALTHKIPTFGNPFHFILFFHRMWTMLARQYICAYVPCCSCKASKTDLEPNFKVVLFPFICFTWPFQELQFLECEVLFKNIKSLNVTNWILKFLGFCTICIFFLNKNHWYLPYRQWIMLHFCDAAHTGLFGMMAKRCRISPRC